jgi:hypothetical protein
MRKLILALVLGLAIEGTAHACSCVAGQSDQQKRQWARDMVNRAVAVVEVEYVNDANGRGDRYRVTRVYAGNAPATFRVDRTGPESTCDDFPGPGERKVVFLYDPRPYPAGVGGAAIRTRAAKSPPSNYIFGGMCQRLFIDQAGNLQLIREEARKLGLAAR